MASTAEPQRLVGRGSALAALRSAADSAAGGRGHLLLVAGEPGIGKTALLREVAGASAAGGAIVLWAQCWDGDGAPPYWPWVQVVRAGVAGGADPGEAARVLPEQAPPRAPAQPGTAEDRFRLFDAVVSFLARLAGGGPAVVVLDDLHWADEGSVRLLEFAARHLAAEAVLLLGAYRNEQATGALRRLAATSEQVRLPGLALPDVAALMTAMSGTAPPPPVTEDVWRRTGGNPFLVRELTRLLVAQGGYSPGAAPATELLDTVSDILERRLARLSQRCVELLTVAAVTGPEVRLEVLTRVVDDADDVPLLVEEAVRARVLLPPAVTAGPYRFSHDLFRETILAGTPHEQRTQLHVAVGRVLERLGEDGSPVHPAELAGHFGAAMAAAPAEAVRYSLLAAEAATDRLGFEEARGHYERALAALEHAGDPRLADRLELLLRLGDARNRVGDAGDAHAAYRDAADLARSRGDATGLARAAIGVHALGWRTVHAESIDLLDEAVCALTDGPSALRADVLAALARDLHHSLDERDWDRAPALAEQAVHVARQLQAPRALAFSLLALHDVRWRPGSAAVRLPIVEEMGAASEAAHDTDLAAQARLLRAAALIELGDPDGPAELEGYCRQSEDLGHARARYGALSRRATAALIAGDLRRAATVATEAFALGQAIGEPDARGVYETLTWAAAFAAGTWRTDGLDADLRLDSDPWPGLPLLEAVLAVAGGERERAGRALARLRPDDVLASHDLERAAFAVQAVGAAGTDELRAGLYERLLPYAGTHIVVGGCASYFGAVDHHLGLLARALGRIEEARDHFGAAGAQHDRLGARAMAQRSRDEAALCDHRAGEEEATFRRQGDTWAISYRGTQVHVPDVKGLRDLAALLQRPGEPIHAVELHTGHRPRTGADEILDGRAKAAYRRRLTELDADVDEAVAANDPYRADRARAERDALVTQLSTALGLGGRGRRLGDESERARKAVTARIRDAIGRIARADPRLGAHLRDAVQTGTWCTYAPADPVRWRQ